MSELEVSAAEEVAQLSMERPHIVILGAGASRATILDGDRNGLRAPLMVDLVETIGLGDLLNEMRIDYANRNFEDVFSELEGTNRSTDRRRLELAIERYFQALALPDQPTTYDHLVLGLRKKDLIATFNWDPLLIQAYSRNGGSNSQLPRLAFLHGNVALGYCATDKTMGLRDDACSLCHEVRTPSPLLYPIKQKDYASNEFIANEWTLFKEYLEHAFWITIFGYGAPTTDQEAMAAMDMAWGGAEARPMEQVEIISIDDRTKLLNDWERFIHSHHVDVVSDFYDSWIAKHPRRTGEAYQNQYWDAKFISDNHIPRGASFSELRTWLAPLLRREGFVIREQPTAGPGM